MFKPSFAREYVSAACSGLLLCDGLLFLEAKTILVNNHAANASDANAGTEALPLPGPRMVIH